MYPGLFGIDESRRRAEELVRAAIAALPDLGGWGGLLRGLGELILARQS